MTFHSIYSQGMARLAAASLPVHLADPAGNAEAIIGAATQASRDGAAVVVFPQLTLTGVTAGDLAASSTVLTAAATGLDKVIAASADLLPVMVVGTPIQFQDRIYNAAVMIHRGRILGVTPKTYPNPRAGTEGERYFADPETSRPLRVVRNASGNLELGSPEVAGSFPFGQFVAAADDLPDLKITIAIPTGKEVPGEATVIAMPCAAPALVGQPGRLNQRLRGRTLATTGAAVLASPGFGESTTDHSWNGYLGIAEDGVLLTSTQHYQQGTFLDQADVDLQALAAKRIRTGTSGGAPAPTVSFTLGAPTEDLGLRRRVLTHPFLAVKTGAEDERDQEAFDIQVSSLMRRMVSIGNPKLVLGVSGGLDSTLALAVAAQALDRLGRPRTDLLTYTMPGFGTSEATRNYAETLCSALGTTFRELDIRPAAKEMLAAMGHPFAAGEPVYDVTFENVQAGLRTDYLFRLANHHGGLVVGTGDLSELALGWCTYGVGDHMSHYDVNGGMPKTAIQQVLGYLADNYQSADLFGPDFAAAARGVLELEISPELVPTDEDSGPQATQSAIGPYELQDFTLYYVLNYGFGPEKIAFLQSAAWGHKYSPEQIIHWLGVFFRRFITQQFKRSAMPDGPQVFPGGSLSPRGGWMVPSDADTAAWQAQIEAMERGQAAARRAARQAEEKGTQ